MVSRVLFKYENDPKKFYELLRPLPSHTELPHIFGKKVITLTTTLEMDYVLIFNALCETMDLLSTAGRSFDAELN